MKDKIKNYLDVGLPLYLPENRAHTDKLHIAIWNCGTRPQTFWQQIKDVRVTIRKNGIPLLVLKKGDV